VSAITKMASAGQNTVPQAHDIAFTMQAMAADGRGFQVVNAAVTQRRFEWAGTVNPSWTITSAAGSDCELNDDGAYQPMNDERRRAPTWRRSARRVLPFTPSRATVSVASTNHHPNQVRKTNQ
jgi:hypothetical protein